MSFAHVGNYVCVCGEVFTYSQKFNGHKAVCKQHLELTGKYDKVIAARKQAAATAVEKGKVTKERKKQARLAEDKLQWESENHVCEKCGKSIPYEFHSLRFCSRSCANSRKVSEETREKQRLNVKSCSSELKRQRIAEYNASPNRCVICNQTLPHDKRNNKTCSQECKNKYLSLSTKHRKETVGKHRIGRHIVYKVTCLLDNRYYIGVRKTDVEFDGYLGSGIHIGNMVKKYGKDNFVRETLFEFDNSTDAFEKEKELLSEHLKNPLCVNIAHGGQGGWTHN